MRHKTPNHFGTIFPLLLLLSLPQPFVFAAEPGLPPVTTYEQLVHAIRGAMAASRERVEQAVEKEKVREAWEIGRLIDAHVLQHKERADYGKYVIGRLSEDLEISMSELYRMRLFARAYPILAPAPKLSWGHYRELLAVKDDKKREQFAQRAEKENWTRSRLRRELRNYSRESVGRMDSDLESMELIASPGEIGIYRVVKASLGPYKGELALDLGFANYYKPAAKLKFKEHEIVSNVSGKLAKLKDAKDTDLFTYRAYILHVLDGDTFHALVDLGFGITTFQTLRLRGLDAPEIESKEGLEAKNFVEKMLKSSTEILIKTVKSDKYDRYLADVWVGKTYLNQQLIDEGLAMRVSE